VMFEWPTPNLKEKEGEGGGGRELVQRRGTSTSFLARLRYRKGKKKGGTTVAGEANRAIFSFPEKKKKKKGGGKTMGARGTVFNARA